MNCWDTRVNSLECLDVVNHTICAHGNNFFSSSYFSSELKYPPRLGLGRKNGVLALCMCTRMLVCVPEHWTRDWACCLPEESPALGLSGFVLPSSGLEGFTCVMFTACPDPSEELIIYQCHSLTKWLRTALLPPFEGIKVFVCLPGFKSAAASVVRVCEPGNVQQYLKQKLFFHLFFVSA